MCCSLSHWCQDKCGSYTDFEHTMGLCIWAAVTRTKEMTNHNVMPISADTLKGKHKHTHAQAHAHTSNRAGTSVRHWTSGLVKRWGGVWWMLCYSFISHCCPLVLIMVGSFKFQISMLQNQPRPFCDPPLFCETLHMGQGCAWVSVFHFPSLFIHLCICMSAHIFAAHEHFLVWMFVLLFSRHSCNMPGLMCNPSQHFKGREAWTDVVLLVHQMGLYDEKSIIPIQASLPSLVHYKAIHSFFYCKK